MSFAALTKPLRSVLDGGIGFLAPPPQSWRPLLVIGTETTNLRASEWCIHAETGQIFHIDVELDHPVELVNSSPLQLALSLAAGLRWSASYGQPRETEGYAEHVMELEAQLRAIEPKEPGRMAEYLVATLQWSELDEAGTIDSLDEFETTAPVGTRRHQPHWQQIIESMRQEKAGTWGLGPVRDQLWQRWP